MTQVVLKDESDIDPNDQNSILEHLHSVVTFFSSYHQIGITILDMVTYFKLH